MDSNFSKLLWLKKLSNDAKEKLHLTTKTPLMEMNLVKKGSLLKYKRFYRLYDSFIVCYKSEAKAKSNILNMKSVLLFDGNIDCEWIFNIQPASEYFQEPYLHQITQKKTLKAIKLTKGEHMTYFFPPDDQEKLESLRDYLRRRVNLKFYMANYKELQEIGKGKYSTVFLSRNLESFKTYAVKVINKDKERLTDREFNLIKNEIKILSSIKHTNVVQLHEVYKSDNTIYIVLELLKGKSLQSLIKSGKHFTMSETSSIIRGLLKALVYLKKENIVHRDLKPDNILFREGKLNENSVCIVDFGFSTLTNHAQFLSIKCGTPGFVAPEVLQLKSTDKLPFTSASDIFAIGIILHILLLGKSPFRAGNYKDMINLNKECVIDYESQIYQNVPKTALELLKSLLEKDPSKRITAEEALNHQFVSLYGKTISRELVPTNQSSANTTILFNNNLSMEEIQADKTIQNQKSLQPSILTDLTSIAIN